MRHFDTAPYYGFGLAEHSIGALGNEARDVRVATKVGLYPPFGRASSFGVMLGKKLLSKAVASRAEVNFAVSAARASLNRSLQALRRESVDLLLLHEPRADLIGTEEWHHWLDRERGLGKVMAFGVSGEVPSVRAVLDVASPLTSVIQTRDSVSLRESDPLRRLGVSPQYTFGHLHALKEKELGSQAISAYLAEHTDTTAVIGTSNAQHLLDLFSSIVAPRS